MTRGFTTAHDPQVYRQNLDKPITRLALPKVLFSGKCAVNGCTNSDIEVHHVRALLRKREGYIVESGKRRITGLSAIESSLARKQIPLCKKHHIAIHNGKISKEDIDLEYLNSKVEIRKINLQRPGAQKGIRILPRPEYNPHRDGGSEDIDCPISGSSESDKGAR